MRRIIASLLLAVFIGGCSESASSSSPIALAEPTAPPPPVLEYPVPVLPDDLADFPLPPGTSLAGSDLGSSDSAYWDTTTDFKAATAFYEDLPPGKWTFVRVIGLLNTADFTVQRDGTTIGQLAVASGSPVHISLRRGVASLPSAAPGTPLPVETPLSFPSPSAIPSELSAELQPSGSATYVGGTTIGDFVYAIWESGQSVAAVVSAYETQLKAANRPFEISTTPSGTGFVLDTARIAIIPITTGSRITVQATVAP